ncbi:hypothetical protein SUNI508_04037 [Seiridium unicorne]|uniref:Uncharacterized protein n=1 Tax=Seiridium unicorne TaxID=138068 RepID=A0ABR2V9R0_9PEZI
MPPTLDPKGKATGSKMVAWAAMCHPTSRLAQVPAPELCDVFPCLLVFLGVIDLGFSADS